MFQTVPTETTLDSRKLSKVTNLSKVTKLSNLTYLSKVLWLRVVAPLYFFAGEAFAQAQNAGAVNAKICSMVGYSNSIALVVGAAGGIIGFSIASFKISTGDHEGPAMAKAAFIGSAFGALAAVLVKGLIYAASSTLVCTNF